MGRSAAIGSPSPAENSQRSFRQTPPHRTLFLGVFLISLATLTLQISLIRLLSVSQGYHFAFLVISMALLGYGAGGSFLTSFPYFLHLDPFRFLSRLAGLFSLTAFSAYFVSNSLPFDLARIAWDPWQIFQVFLFYLIFSVPFFFSGMAISSALARWGSFSGKIYSSDLAGASLGCLLMLIIFDVLGGEGALLLGCFIATFASAAFAWKDRLPFILACLWAGFLFALILLQPSFTAVSISPYTPLGSALRFPGAALLETRWNAVSRIDVLKSPAARTAPGLSLQYLETLPPQVGVAVNGGRLSAITRVREKPEEPDLAFLDFLPSSLPYSLAPRCRALLLEPGGGLEVLQALRQGAEEIVAVERNPAMVRLLRGAYRDYSGKIYLHPKVRVVAEEGRTFVRRAEPGFDLIVFPLTESLGALSTGFSALQEEYRYTAEAVRDCLRLLKPGGFLAFSLYLLPPPRGELRLLATVKKALDQGKEDPARQIMAFRSWGTFSLLVKKGPVAPGEIQELRSFCRERRFDLVYFPGISPVETNRFNRFPTPLYSVASQKLLQQEEDFYSEYPFDIKPVTDDRPFFHSFFKWDRFTEIYRLSGGKWQILLEGGFLIPAVFILALLLSFFFIVFPLLRAKVSGSEGKQGRPAPWLMYFSCLGLGFMFVEVSLIQKFILFLGDPVYSVSLVIFALLVSAGLGSRFSGWIPPGNSPGFKLVLAGAIVLLFLSVIYLPLIMSYYQGQTIFWRQLVCLLFIFPLGFFMGMPFPLGIRFLSTRRASLIPWAWCANGCASVLGSLLPAILAPAWGFQTVFLLSGFLYTLSLLTLWKSS